MPWHENARTSTYTLYPGNPGRLSFALWAADPEVVTNVDAIFLRAGTEQFEFIRDTVVTGPDERTFDQMIPVPIVKGGRYELVVVVDGHEYPELIGAEPEPAADGSW